MSANLTPAYRAAEERFRAAITAEEKLAALEEMLREVPKHKGTEKIQADLKSRISKLRRQPKKKTGARGPTHHIPREGAGQVVLVGPPNAGKSALVARLTHASPEVAEYPLSTREATPGMMPFEDVSIQLVDLPPICEEHVEPWVYDSIRTADLVWLVVTAESSLEGLELVDRLLGEKAIALAPVGREGPDEPRPGWLYKPAVLVITGLDRPDAREDLELLDQLVEVPWDESPVSSVSGEGLEELGRRTFEALGVMRVYSKQPGKEPDLEQPFTLPLGSTVGDLARLIHQDLAAKFKFARVWGPSAFDGQKVQTSHVLEEGDVVEIHF
ncbi:MAG: TGS domain-containing protein [Acidobacteria bacterium]|nr:MAG: TGS domain-containing protein [Acidobacteriota bacterium]